MMPSDSPLEVRDDCLNREWQVRCGQNLVLTVMMGNSYSVQKFDINKYKIALRIQKQRFHTKSQKQLTGNQLEIYLPTINKRELFLFGAHVYICNQMETITLQRLNNLSTLAGPQNSQERDTILTAISTATKDELDRLQIVCQAYQNQNVAIANMIADGIQRRKAKLPAYIESRKERLKEITAESLSYKKWKLFIVSVVSLLIIFVFGGVILGRTIVETDATIIPFANITSMTECDLTQLTTCGTIASLTVKTHAKSLTLFQTIVFIVGMAIIVALIVLWAYGYQEYFLPIKINTRLEDYETERRQIERELMHLD